MNLSCLYCAKAYIDRYNSLVNISFRTQMVLAAAAFFAVAITIAATLTFPARHALTPAAMLPADATVAFFADIDARTARNIEQYIPIVHSLPIDTQTSTFAVFATDSGPAWVKFAPPAPGTDKPVLTASNPTVLDLLATHASTLQNNESFQKLLSTREPASSWMYLRSAKDTLQLPSPLAAPAAPLSMSLSENGMEIAWIAHTHSDPLTIGHKSILKHPALTLDAGNVHSFMGNLTRAIHPHESLAYESLMKQWLRKHVGPNLSAEFDVLPLLDNQASLAIGTKDGRTVFVMEGIATDDPSELVTALHQGYASTMGLVSREQHVFDEKFTHDSLLIDSSIITHERVNENGWHQERTKNMQTHTGLFSALRGDRFILSNDNTLLEDALRLSPVAHASKGSLKATGSMDSAAMADVMKTVLPGAVWPRGLPSGSGGLLHWEIFQSGDARVLRLF